MHIPEPVTETVLLIDTDDALPKLHEVFEREGYTVLSANNIADGVTMARTQRPDLIVSEVMLDTPDAGFILGYRLKQDEQTANIPLILLSSIFRDLGVGFDVSSAESRRWVKAELYLDRPVTPERLLAKARGVLQRN